MGRRLLLVPLLSACLTASIAWAQPLLSDYEPLVLAQYSGTATDTRIQSRGCGWNEVAWRAPDGTIASRGIHNRSMQPLISHGAGKDPVLSLGMQGIYLAWASGNEVKVTASLGEWGPVVNLSTGAGLAPHHPDFCASLDGGDPNLAWIEGSKVIFAASLPGGGWAAPEVVANDAVSSDWYGLQVENTITQRPRVYYFDGSSYQVVYRERTGVGQWTAPFTLPIENSDFAWPFRVAAMGGVYGLHSMLHVGMYRTCPCNEIYLDSETSNQTWGAPQPLTVDRDAYNWPRELGLTITPDGLTYCVWYEEFFDQGLGLTGKETFCRVLGPSGWYEPQLDGLAPGHYPDVASGDCVGGSNAPELCWIEQAPPGTKVMVLRDNATGSDVPDTAPAISLSIAPNPSRGAFTIVWPNPSGEEAKLEVLGVDGRLIRSFGSRGPGVWDGRDLDGKEAPGGAYWIRLRSESSRATARVIVIR